MPITMTPTTGFIASTGLGLISSLFGANSQRKQQEDIINRAIKINQDNYNRQVQLANPFIQAGYDAINQLKNFTNESNVNRFKTNYVYDQAREVGLRDAQRYEAQAKKSASYSFANNEGRARGERTRIGRQFISNKNQINFDWARQTESDRMQKTQQYLQGLTMLNNNGYTGANMMTNAYNNYTHNAMNLYTSMPTYSPMSTIGGSLIDIGANGLISLFDQPKTK